MGRCDRADAHIGAFVIIGPQPLSGVVVCRLNAFNDMLVQQFVLDRLLVALDICSLLRLAGLDVLGTDTALLGPSDLLTADIPESPTPAPGAASS